MLDSKIERPSLDTQFKVLQDFGARQKKITS